MAHTTDPIKLHALQGLTITLQLAKFSSDQKISEKVVPLNFTFNMTLFSNIFVTSKNEQEGVGKILQFLSIRGRRLHLRSEV